MNSCIGTTEKQAFDLKAPSAMRRVLRSVWKEVRRAIELAGAPYQDGTLPMM